MRTAVLLSLTFLMLAGCSDSGSQPAFDASVFNGRWDITVPSSARKRAWWLEVRGAETPNPTGLMVGPPGGGMYPPDTMKVEGEELVYTFKRKYGIPGEKTPWDKRPLRTAVYHVRVEGDKLTGWMEIEGHPETRVEFFGERAPEITDKDDGTWVETEPVELFNGKDLTGWHGMIPDRELGWEVKDGILTNNPPANNLVSDKKFWNFKLHAEYRLVKGSNSGIGLRGRYEVQIIDDYGKPPTKQGHGAIYYRIVPSENASLPPGKWQTMDVTLIGRDVTVVLNGKKIIDKAVIEGLTAMAHDPHEGEPGPISIQGDHRKIEIRKLTVTPLVREQ